MKERLMKEIFKNRTIRMIAGAAATIGGLSGIVYPQYDYLETHSPANTDKIVERLVPGYNPEAFRKAGKVVFDFKQQVDLTAKTIEVPDHVTQAATFIREERETYNEGRKLNDQMRRKIWFRDMGVVGGAGIAVIIGGIVFAKNLPSEAKVLTTQRKKSSPAQTSS